MPCRASSCLVKRPCLHRVRHMVLQWLWHRCGEFAKAWNLAIRLARPTSSEEDSKSFQHTYTYNISADPVASSGWRLRRLRSHIPWPRHSKATHVHARLLGPLRSPCGCGSLFRRAMVFPALKGSLPGFVLGLAQASPLALCTWPRSVALPKLRQKLLLLDTSHLGLAFGRRLLGHSTLVAGTCDRWICYVSLAKHLRKHARPPLALVLWHRSVALPRLCQGFLPVSDAPFRPSWPRFWCVFCSFPRAVLLISRF